MHHYELRRVLKLNTLHRIERFVKPTMEPISAKLHICEGTPFPGISAIPHQILQTIWPRPSPSPSRTRLANSIDALSQCSLEAAGASRCPTTALTMHCYHITRLSGAPKAKISCFRNRHIFHHALASLLSHRKYVTASHRLFLTPCVSLQPFHRSCRLI